MFEKESQDYAMREVAPRQELYIKGRADIDADYEKVKMIWQDGAVFGYNKANEWHYVKDELPQDNEYVLIYTEIKNTYVARIPTGKDYFITRSGGFVQMSAVIAWKEIVLPELK